MPTLTFKTRIEASAEDLFAWHARPGAFMRLAPPWAGVSLERFEGIRDGQRAVIRIGAGPLRLRWVAEHHGYAEGRQFCDRQVEGPFRRWNHTHRMEPDGPDACHLVDHLDYELPLGSIGRALGGAMVRRELARQFAYRHAVTRHDVAMHRRYNLEGGALRVAVSGASGLIGAHLVPLLTTGGHAVRRLVRSRPATDDAIYWNHRTGEIEAKKLEGLDAVIHLAGENVFALRWSAQKKRRIRESRVAGTRLLSETLARLERPPGVFVCASGIGYYGNRGDEALTEAAAAARSGFLAAVTRDWEAATEPAAEAGIRTARLRLGVVLSPQGGALRVMLPAFRLGLGGRVGPKDAYLSWIALDDALGALYHVLMTDVAGPVNLTAPAPVTTGRFAKTLAHVLRRPAGLAVPAGLARLVTGEVAGEVLLTNARVLPHRLQQAGYAFRFPELERALRHLLGRPRAS